MREHLRERPADFQSTRPVAFPCAGARLIPADRIVANDYNPNWVAAPELAALAGSIALCGLTQPVVVCRDAGSALYVLVDGFHRFVILRHVLGMAEIPAVVLDRDAGRRIASTVRHNKAKGEHTVTGMAHLMRLLTAEDLGGKEIATRLGMEGEEVLRLKLIEGIT